MALISTRTQPHQGEIENSIPPKFQAPIVTAFNGLVSVTADAVPGTVTLSYTICDIAHTTNCATATATATVTIPAPAIVATADGFNLPPGSAADLLANDTWGATPATATTVTFTSTASTLPSTASVSAVGLVSVGAGTAAGTYTIDYTICQAVAATNCASAVATITVPETVSMTGTALDNATGLGIAGASNASGAYYEGSVSHFTTWNADQTYNTVRITGCVADASGTPVAGAQVQSDGVDYSGTSSALTDASGNFTMALRLNSSATVVGVAAGRLTNTLRAGPYGADTALPACLALGDTGAGITMKLTWGAAPSDLDSHLFAPSGFEVYFGRKGSLLSDPFANLDVDDTSSYGPEVVTITRLMVGTYKYSVNNYSGYGTGPITASGAKVELNIPGRSLELFTPARGETSGTNWWNLFEFDVDAACNVTVRRVGTFTSVKPAVASATATYCTPP